MGAVFGRVGDSEVISYGLNLGWGDLDKTINDFGGDLLRDILQIYLVQGSHRKWEKGFGNFFILLSCD